MTQEREQRAQPDPAAEFDPPTAAAATTLTPRSSSAASLPSGGSRPSGGARTSASARGRLGAGLIEVPLVPLRDPADAVMAHPQVPEGRRYCGHCRGPVGRATDSAPGRTEGNCERCDTPYSFIPRLAAGDVVASRYEILGCIAHGGLGWIYLARDRHVSDDVADRWVVLKGLINTTDAAAMATAVTERRFLVEVDHPNIVKIHDFVSHPDPVTGTPVSFLVMEYVGGRSLRDVLRDQPGGGSLPLARVLAYGVEILPALGYLHDHGLLFCDFKPDNVIHAEEQLKLIDLGAVRRIDDQVSMVWGTPGYQAPEVPTAGPSISSDLYTVGRTLAVLSLGVPGMAVKYPDRLPDVRVAPLLAREESYHRWLRRATHQDPAYRFDSAAEMSEQLLGVLRQVVAASDDRPRPAPSTRFTAERQVFGAGPQAGGAGTGAGAAGTLDGAAVAAALPLPQVDLTDPGAVFLATLAAAGPAERLAALESAPIRSTEVTLRLVSARLAQGDQERAAADLEAVTGTAPRQWRVDWHRGLVALAAGKLAEAHAAFDRVYDALPGELPPQLALAAAAELASDTATAATRYERVWRTDQGWVSAAFGLARVRLARGDRSGAVQVLDQVPESSRHHLAAEIAAARARLAVAVDELDRADLLDAAARIERLELDLERQARLSLEVLRTALDWIRAGQPDPVARVLGRRLTERQLRFGLEHAYRILAKLARDRDTRIDLVDRANAVRPRTLI